MAHQLDCRKVHQGPTLKDHLKAISHINPRASDPFLFRDLNGLYECKLCFAAFANEKRYVEHTRSETHRRCLQTLSAHIR